MKKILAMAVLLISGLLVGPAKAAENLVCITGSVGGNGWTSTQATCWWEGIVSLGPPRGMREVRIYDGDAGVYLENQLQTAPSGDRVSADGERVYNSDDDCTVMSSMQARNRAVEAALWVLGLGNVADLPYEMEIVYSTMDGTRTFRRDGLLGAPSDFVRINAFGAMCQN